jgi:hypothetical protein
MCQGFNQLFAQLTNSTDAFAPELLQSWSQGQRQYATQFLAAANYEYANAIKEVFASKNIWNTLKKTSQEGLAAIGQAAAVALAQQFIANFDEVASEFGKAFASAGISLVFLVSKGFFTYFKDRKKRRHCTQFLRGYLDVTVWNAQVHQLVIHFTNQRGPQLAAANIPFLTQLISSDLESSIRFIRKRQVPVPFDGELDLVNMWDAG